MATACHKSEAKAKAEAVHAVTKDIISELPRTVIESILECMPIQDAVKTSILSRKWRYKWAMLPQLVFDYKFFEYLDNKGDQVSEFASIIDKVLLLHTSPIIKFVLYNPPEHSARTEDIDQWILFLSRNGIKDFTLQNSSVVRYKLPTHLFACPELAHLKLSKCTFNLPSDYKGFRNLLSLQFRAVTYAADSFGSFISGCPRLETLALDYCPGSGHLNIHAPNLKHLSVRGALESIRIHNAQNLLTLSICESQMRRSSGPNMIRVLGCLPMIEKLDIGLDFYEFLAAGDVPKRLPTEMNCLKNLTLESVDFSKVGEILCALCLLRSSPNLQELDISATRNADMVPALNFLEEDCRLNRLQVVKFRSIIGLESELELIKSLLACSPLLERMFIGCHAELDANAMLMMSKELLRFRRASPKAEIIFGDPLEDPLEDIQA
uniref:F-box domain-containing protein n=1 Tax=Davidia involucrata TaxID=16924 RepID=A0A5B7AK66_DAVIN